MHEAVETSYHHPSGLRMVWKYDDVRTVLEATVPGLSAANSLDPLVGYRRIAATPSAIPPFVQHLFPPPAKATANLTDKVLHAKVWSTMAGADGHFTIPPGQRDTRAATMSAHFHAALNAADTTSELDVTALSITYAARITAEAVGLPPEAWPNVAVWSGAQSGLLGRHLRGRELGTAVQALGWLFTVSARTVADGSGLAHRLREADIPRRVAVSAMANSLAAGVHTVSGTIQQGLERLLTPGDRRWWDMLAEQSQAGRVALKLLQLDPGLVAWKRKAERPITLPSGATLSTGPVLALFAAANRDPAAFPDLWSMDGKGKLPLTFGFGRHICPGKQLAALAIEVFLRELHALAPHAELVPTSTRRPADLLFSGADIAIASS
ncbi:hypothetical protein [Nocardia neocaledoniensis]|uniref:hypothetical protein n=1 Tax=Nocardia neocaledoniensis TaxID=236511 RepID=UPI0011B486C2|nr:hypothetical protein [Nocardia neocaledoniensis]